MQYERQIGIPSGRVSVAEPALGMWTRRTGGAWYVPDLARSSSDGGCSPGSPHSPPPLCPSTPTAPSLRVWPIGLAQPVDVDEVSQGRESHLRALPASSAIRCRFVDTSTGSDAPAMFPSNGSLKRHPLPSAGSLGEFPRLVGTMGRSDSLPPISPRFVAFAWRYHRFVPRSSPRAGTGAVDHLELVSRVPGRHHDGDGKVSPSSRETQGHRILKLTIE